MATRSASPVFRGAPVVGRRAFLGMLGASIATIGLAGCSPEVSAPVVVAPSASSPSPSARPSGVPTIPGRTLTWSQDFDGAAGTSLARSDWYTENSGSGFGNDELEAYTPRPTNVALDGDGSLAIRAYTEEYTDPAGQTRSYTSGRVESESLFLYGRIEARIKAPVGQGLWPAFWLLGEYSDGIVWPATGEIDIMEYVNQADTLHANAWGDTADGSSPWSLPGRLAVDPGFAQEWHIYSVEWSADSLEFAVDDAPFHQVLRSDLGPNEVWRLDRPQTIILNLAVGGGFPGAVGDSSIFPAEMLVDHVRIYDSELIQRT